jgi:antitoxin HigA-1
MKVNLSDIYHGEILLEDFLKPMNISSYRLAKVTHIDPKRISDIIHGKRSITADTALRFSKFFGNSPQFWLNIQNHYDLEMKKEDLDDELDSIMNIKELQLL